MVAVRGENKMSHNQRRVELANLKSVNKAGRLNESKIVLLNNTELHVKFITEN